MKILPCALVITLFFCCIETFSEESVGADTYLTEKHKLFTDLIVSFHDPVEVKWINPFTIDVTFDFLDATSETENKKLAELLAKLGNEITHEKICASITDTDGKERAYHCVDKTNEFAEEQVLITETQEEIARRIKTISGVTQVKWMTPSLLEISIDFGLDPKSTGEKIAEMLTPWVNESTGKPVCLRITNTDKEEVAYKCVGKDQQI
ncbi:MAG: hypothetical protein AB7V12_06935 [Candidatus Dadabacteria bacterium]